MGLMEVKLQSNKYIYLTVTQLRYESYKTQTVKTIYDNFQRNKVLLRIIL